MRKAAAVFALVALAGLGALVALGQASAGDSGASTGTATQGTTRASTVSSSVVVHNSSSCNVSVTAVNGVTTTTKSGDCGSNSSCSVSVDSVNGVTTTTKTGDCADATITTSGIALNLDLLRTLIADVLVWFRFAAGM